MTSVVANALTAAGYQVAIVSIVKGSVSFFDLDSRVKLHSLQMENHSANLSDLRIVRKLRKYFQATQFDWIIDVDCILTLYSAPACWNTGAKLLSWEHFTLHSNVGDLPQRVRRWLGRRIAARWADAIVTLTERDRGFFLRELTPRVPVVAIANSVTLQRATHVGHRDNEILAVGRLVYQKGFDLLVRVWGLVAPVYPEWRLKIVGSGPDLPLLIRIASHCNVIHRIDFVPVTANISEHYASASILVSSSRFEGLPLVLLEAKSFGVPIVAFDCECGPGEIVRHGEDGLLVEPGDEVALASALSELIEDEPRRKRMGAAAAQDDRFTMERILPMWCELLQ